jgi:hypothetical protein
MRHLIPCLLILETVLLNTVILLHPLCRLRAELRAELLLLLQAPWEILL